MKFRNLFSTLISIFISILLVFIISCDSNEIKTTSEILISSEAGDKLATQENVEFQNGKPEGTTLSIFPKQKKQKIDGIGTSFTESSAFVLAHLSKEQRAEVMEKIFGESGADFTLTRTHIGACDFCVDGRYSYTDVKGDKELKHFSLAPDSEGFSKKRFPHIDDEKYDLLPMIKEALSIKNKQKDNTLRIVSSAWTAPSWMKDIEEWYIPGAPENGWQGTGGSLKPEYVSSYADYIVKYLDGYKKEGIDIWGLTPVNEPHGNNGQWESMNFSPETQNDFIKKHLGPKLHKAGYEDINLLIFDQNRDGIEHWTDLMFTDPDTKQYLYGVAVHWYESTHKVYEEVFERVHKKFPEFSIIHTEGCIDDLGKEPPGGCYEPVKRKESGWFDNDDFWWNDNATDWAYCVTWQGVKTEDHPVYTPVHRYARNIIVSLDHWMKGWIDWNIILDKQGGPNHVGNFCGAPIMIDTETDYVYYTPIYYVLAQFSKTIRPNDFAVQTQKTAVGLESDDIHTCATINADNVLSVQVLNTTKKPINYNLQIGDKFAEIEIKANSVQTVRVQL